MHEGGGVLLASGQVGWESKIYRPATAPSVNEELLRCSRTFPHTFDYCYTGHRPRLAASLSPSMMQHQSHEGFPANQMDTQLNPAILQKPQQRFFDLQQPFPGDFSSVAVGNWQFLEHSAVNNDTVDASAQQALNTISQR